MINGGMYLIQYFISWLCCSNVTFSSNPIARLLMVSDTCDISQRCGTACIMQLIPTLLTEIIEIPKHCTTLCKFSLFSIIWFGVVAVYCFKNHAACSMVQVLQSMSADVKEYLKTLAITNIVCMGFSISMVVDIHLMRKHSHIAKKNVS